MRYLASLCHSRLEVISDVRIFVDECTILIIWQSMNQESISKHWKLLETHKSLAPAVYVSLLSVSFFRFIYLTWWLHNKTGIFCCYSSTSFRSANPKFGLRPKLGVRLVFGLSEKTQRKTNPKSEVAHCNLACLSLTHTPSLFILTICIYFKLFTLPDTHKPANSVMNWASEGGKRRQDVALRNCHTTFMQGLQWMGVKWTSVKKYSQ